MKLLLFLPLQLLRITSTASVLVSFLKYVIPVSEVSAGVVAVAVDAGSPAQ